jgi:hypothetical protein
MPQRARLGSVKPILTLFVGVPDLATLKRVLMLGLAELAVAGAVVLCPDPRTAARLAGSSGDARGMYRVVLCRVTLGRVHDLRAGADALQALPNAAAAHLAALPANCCAARLEAGHAQALGSPTRSSSSAALAHQPGPGEHDPRNDVLTSERALGLAGRSSPSRVARQTSSDGHVV